MVQPFGTTGGTSSSLLVMVEMLDAEKYNKWLVPLFFLGDERCAKEGGSGERTETNGGTDKTVKLRGNLCERTQARETFSSEDHSGAHEKLAGQTRSALKQFVGHASAQCAPQ